MIVQRQKYIYKIADDRILFIVLNMIIEVPKLTCQSDNVIVERFDRSKDKNLTDVLLFVRKLCLIEYDLKPEF